MKNSRFFSKWFPKVKNEGKRIILLFTLTVCGLLFVEMILAAGIVMLLMHWGWFSGGDISSHLITLYLLILFFIIGASMTYLIGNHLFVPLNDLNESMKKVTNGDYTVQVKEDVGFSELREMSRNFNIMVRELNNTTIIHSDFTRNVSHEFKTPLSTIEGYATLLENRDLTEEERYQYAAAIVESTHRLTKLTGNILELSRLENQTIHITKEDFSLDEQLREVILLYESAWEEKSLDIEPDLPETTCHGNRELLFHVWQNLLNNAIKFTPSGGCILINIKDGKDSLSVTISDNGLPISSEDQKRIFEQFYQADTSHTSDGNGLGLPIACKVVSLHGGSISVESNDELTSFTVTLPKNRSTT